jgi:SAM-dependent methyltransferase
MFDVLEHFDRPEQALGQVRKILKKGGLFHLFIPLERQPFTLYWLILHKLDWDAKERQAGHRRKYDLEGVVQLLEDSGFEVKRVRFSNHFVFQAVDLFFHLVWEWFPTVKPSVSVETYLSQERNPLRRIIFGLIKNVIALLFYLESWLLQRVPGGGVSVTAIKNS